MVSEHFETWSRLTSLGFVIWFRWCISVVDLVAEIAGLRGLAGEGLQAGQNLLPAKGEENTEWKETTIEGRPEHTLWGWTPILNDATVTHIVGSWVKRS